MQNILVLEDDINQLNGLNNKLVKYFPQITVHLCMTIEEALKIYTKEVIDIIFVDLQLKGENGLDFIKQIRETMSHCWIFIMTGEDVSIEREIEFYYNGDCTKFLRKPLTDRIITESINMVINKKIVDANREELIINRRDSIIKLNLENVLFFETSNKRTFCNILLDGEVRTIDIGRYPLKKLLDQLEERFQKSYNAYIVNTKYIEEARFIKNQWFLRLYKVDRLLEVGKQFDQILEKFK